MKQTVIILLVHYASLNRASSEKLGSKSFWGHNHHHQRPSSRRRRGTRRYYDDSTSSCCFAACDASSSHRRGRDACFISGTLANVVSLRHHVNYQSKPIISSTGSRNIVPSSVRNTRCEDRNIRCNFSFALSSTTSKSIVDEGPKRKNKGSNKSESRSKKKKGNEFGSGQNNRRRMKKSEIDDLVRGIGLKPVAPPSSTKKKRNVAIAPNNDTIDPQLLQNDEHEHPSISDTSSMIQQQTSTISLQTQLDYHRNGHAALRSFLSPTLVRRLRSELVPYASSHALSAWRQKVEVQLADSPDEHYRRNAREIANELRSVEDCMDLLESLGMDPTAGDLPFLQHFNTWRSPSARNNDLPAVRTLCLSPHLAKTASVLLDAPTVRLYQDSLFHKRAGDGWTPWHSDARMAPFDTSRMITFWIPLRRVPSPEEGGTGLLFADGSHSDFALPYWNGAEGDEYDRLEERYGGGGGDGVSHHMPLELGDVTVHNGWTLHSADATTDSDEDVTGERYAFSITFVDGRAELRENVLLTTEKIDDVQKNGLYSRGNTADKGDKEDIWSFRSWAEDIEPRTDFRHPEVPIVWPLEQRQDVE